MHTRVVVLIEVVLCKMVYLTLDNSFMVRTFREKLVNVEEFLYSPAEIINIYVANKNEEVRRYACLLEH